MTSPLNALKRSITSLWEGTAPPDRPEITYHRADGRSEPDGSFADRAFWFNPSRRMSIDSEGPGVTYVRWQLQISLFLAGVGRSLDEIEEASTNEQNLLLRRIEQQGDAWRPSGVHAVLTDSPDVDVDSENGDYLISFYLTALVAETDGS